MSKMLWEVKAPLAIAKAKEDMGLNNIFKYLRYYRMFIERVRWEHDGKDLTNRIENILFWRGKVAFAKDPVYGLIVAEIDAEKRDPNGNLVSVDISAENGWKKRNLEVGKDVVILYADQTRFAPVLYIWAIANEIIEREDIIDTQDNMLRKPIMVAGEGAQLDDAMTKMSNILSGVAWFNYNPKGTSKGQNILEEKGLEVLNLQLGNAYKGKELWESRGKFEDLLKDYLGYTTVNNEKKERMIQAEVSQSQAICDTFYKSSMALKDEAKKQVGEALGLELNLTKMLEQEKQEKEVDDNGSEENKVANSSK